MADSRLFCQQARELARAQESPLSKLKDKWHGCDRERYSLLLEKTIFDCSYDSEYLNLGSKSKDPKVIAKIEKRSAKCDQWQKEFDELDKVCSRLKK
jgi:hypothetical protein